MTRWGVCIRHVTVCSGLHHVKKKKYNKRGKGEEGSLYSEKNKRRSLIPRPLLIKKKKGGRKKKKKKKGGAQFPRHLNPCVPVSSRTIKV